jgi:hypothetical protein
MYKKLLTLPKKKAAESQEMHSQAAQYAGYVREVIQATSSFYVHIAQMAEDIPELRDVVASGVKFVNSIDNEFYLTNKQSRPILYGLSGMSDSAEIFCDTSGTITPSIYSQIVIPSFEAPPLLVAKQPNIEDKLFAIDPTLAATYREIGQIYHRTTADPARAALSMMRQTFDHLFGTLAPDEQVRKSPYWKQKSGPEPDQVTRRERMIYTAFTYIPHKARAETLVANIDNILETYKILNKLHTRGALAEGQAKRALKTMSKFIETWADAIEL